MTVLQRMTQEAGSRTNYLILATFACGMVNFYYSATWILFICLPITQIDEKVQFIYTDVAEAFGASWLTALSVTFFFCTPIFFYQIMSFWNPAFFFTESFRTNLFGLYFFLLSFFIQYKFLTNWLTTLITFFLKFQLNYLNYPLLTLQPKILSYLNFVGYFYLSCQVLLMVFFIGFTCLPKLVAFTWKQHKNLVIFFCCLFVAFVLPPDLFLQILVTMQVLLCLEVSGFLVVLRNLYQEKQ